MRRKLSFLSLTLLFVFSQTLVLNAEPGDKTPLVVFVVIDGLPYKQFSDSLDRLGPDGLKFFARSGAFFTNANYGFANTSTAPAHATLVTGLQPRDHKIISNEWIENASGRIVYSTEDPDHRYLDESMGKRRGTSPKNLQAGALGDALIEETQGRSKVIAISLKDRAAILLAGKKGTAYFYSAMTGRFITSTYYMKDYPDWLKAFNALKTQDQWFGKKWEPLQKTETPAAARKDYKVDFLGLRKEFPHSLTGGLDSPGPEYYSALSKTPFAEEHMLSFIEAAITAENLGRNSSGAPDMLLLSFSAHDYANHFYGPDSLESEDHLSRLDLLIARLRKIIDARTDRAVWVITSDHGFSSAPEECHDAKEPAKRMNPDEIRDGLNRYLSNSFGEGVYISAWSNPTFHLNKKLILSKNLKMEKVEQKASEFLTAYEGIAHVFTSSGLSRTGELSKLETQILRSWDPASRGEITVIQKTCWYLLNEPHEFASNHGTPYEYDSHVPLIFSGGAFKNGNYDFQTDMVSVAPTLARTLGVSLPGAEGKAIEEIFLEKIS